jgi:hypothetical protein
MTQLLSDLGVAAVRYTLTGWSVFPLQVLGKAPATAHGFADASAQPETVASWWLRVPDANIGVACGASRLVVVDVDPDNDGDHTHAQLIRWGHHFPPTMTQLTPSGGCHLVYQAPSERQLHNTAGRLPGIPDPTPGIDVRADGGYIVAAPSRTPVGEYEWLPTWPKQPAPLPYWLREPPPQPRRTFHTYKAAPAVPRLAGLARTVAEAPEGVRNATLNWAAYSARDLTNSVSVGVIAETLAEAARTAGLSEREVSRTLRSGLGVP